jgi:hypothetical protein
MTISLDLITKRTIPLLFVISFFSSCYYDNQDELHPTAGLAPCDTTGTISYLNDIVPILDTYCGTSNSSCHAPGHSTGGLSLGDYQTVVDNSANIVSSITPGTHLVPMPYQSGPLNVCDREKITAWVNRGALNN